VESLKARGHRVIGAGRRAPTDAVVDQHETVDLSRPDTLGPLLARHHPDLIFHAAAVHGSAGSAYEESWLDMLAVNTGSLHPILEYARTLNPQARIVYLGSGKVYGPQYPAVVSEDSPRAGTCLYTTTKMASEGLIGHYRRAHGVKASVIHTFNHESERRPAGFFTARLADALATALAAPGSVTRLHTLDFHCDWGSAREFMDIAVDAAERAPGVDFILGSGRTLVGRDLAHRFFARHGLDADRHIETAVPPGPPQDAPYQVDLTRLETHLGRRPVETIETVLDRMLEARRIQ
jgi:GDPmannose 4,6-dehydratase